MASVATQTDDATLHVGETCVLPAPPGRQLADGRTARTAGIRDLFRMYAALAGQAVETAKLSALGTYHRARRGAIESYSFGTRKAQEMATSTWNRAGDLKREHPVRVLAILAATAFLAGAASRMWRSRNL